MKFSAFLIFTIVFLLNNSCGEKEKTWKVNSPDGNIEFVLVQKQIDHQSRLYYYVNYIDNGKVKEAIKLSPLGIALQGQEFIDGLMNISASEVISINETYDVISGKQKTIANKANEINVTFENSLAARFQIIARAYNDGVAFRYHFLEKGKEDVIDTEITGFSIPAKGKAWLQPYDKVTKWSPGYERYFENAIEIGSTAPSEEGWTFPALFQSNGLWTLLTEADLGGNCYAAHLNQKADSGLYTIRLPEKTEANNVCGSNPTITMPWKSPWRVAIIGTSLSTVVESNLVTNLSEASQVNDTSWIKPGRSSWSWWSAPESPKDFRALKKFIDYSAEMGWEYSLVDANWDLMKGGNIEELCKYAQEKNIGIWLWYNSGGPHNNVTERPRDIMNDPINRKEEFRKISSWGVKGIKVDFFQSDKPCIIQEYIDILKDAADAKIMVNFHGCTLPRGWNRTWPNLLSMESIKGAENYGFDSSYTAKAPVLNTIIPFTRNVVGPVDYTPVTFSNNRYPHSTTYSHELALSIVFETGILHLADRIEAYKALPKEPLEFLKKVPVTWDETRLIAGIPGEYCIIARRKADVWYIGGISARLEPMDLEFDVSILGKKGFLAQIISDGNNATKFESAVTSIKPGDLMKVHFLPNGGFVATLKSVK